MRSLLLIGTASRQIGLVSARGSVCGFSSVLLASFLDGLRIKGIEIDRLKQELRETTARDEIGYRFAREWVKRSGAIATEQHIDLFPRISL